MKDNVEKHSKPSVLGRTIQEKINVKHFCLVPGTWQREEVLDFDFLNGYRFSAVSYGIVIKVSAKTFGKL
jgi:hypothetical protein